MNDEYKKALAQAQENLKDLEERGDDAISDDDWEDLKAEIFTPAEISAMNLKAMIISEIIKARQERGISQYQLEELSGVKQSAIARLERGNINPTIETLQKILAPLGKRLAVVSI
jgi:DNA-binding XRE family transcriptional regulator